MVLSVFPVGANLGCVTEEDSSAAEVKHELQTSPSQPVSFTSSPIELNDTLHMDPSDVKLDPSADTPAPGMLGCGVLGNFCLFICIQDVYRLQYCSSGQLSNAFSNGIQILIYRKIWDISGM